MMSTLEAVHNQQRHAATIQTLAAELGAKVTHLGGIWWEVVFQAQTRKVRGASHVVLLLEGLKKTRS